MGFRKKPSSPRRLDWCPIAQQSGEEFRRGPVLEDATPRRQTKRLIPAVKNKKQSPVGVGVSVEPRYLTLKQAALYMGATVWCLRNLAWDRRVPFVKLGNRFVFDKADLDKFIESEKVQVAA